MPLPLSLLLLLLLLLSLLTFSAGEAPPSRSSIPLHRLAIPRRADPLDHLAALASASLARARHLKDRKASPRPRPPSPSSSSALSPHSYGGYSLTLGFGTPPQPIPLVFDTGSELSWLPCTSSYLCHNCNSTAAASSGPIPTFLPKSSSTSALIGCKNPKCQWIHSPSRLASCLNCPSSSNSSSSNCPQICPPYIIIYGSGSTAGVLLSETLDLPGRIVPNFAVGCSLFSSKQPSGGIAGFGRGSASLPSQLGLRRFSYCLVSRRFDDDGVSGTVVLDPVSEDSSDGTRFTPFIKNLNAGNDSVFAVYYYVELKKVMVGGKSVKIPRESLVPGLDGNGGVIVDSGTTFTYMAPAAFEPLAEGLAAAVGKRYRRAEPVEISTGLRPCFELPAGAQKEVELPELSLRFKGGAEMKLPIENYFAFTGGSGAEAVCLTIVSDGGPAASGGPAMILGSFQQQNYHVLYDLERERIGFRPENCVGS